MVESCINDLKARFVRAGLIKVGTPAGVTDALFFGAVMALSGFDAASKLAGPGSSAVDSGVRLQACNVVKQAVDRFLPGAAPPPPPPPPTQQPLTPAQQEADAYAVAADVGFVPRLVALGLGAVAATTGFLLLR
jgi:hypothetical protein